MAFWSSSGWFWPSFDDPAVRAAARPVAAPARRSDRWAQPAHPPARARAGAPEPAPGPAETLERRRLTRSAG